MRRSSSLLGVLCPSRAVHTEQGDNCNSLNSVDTATIAAGIEGGSCLWTTGVSACDLTRRGLAESMSMVKLEGMGEGMLAELVEDMLKRIDDSFDLDAPLLFTPFLFLCIFGMIALD